MSLTRRFFLGGLAALALVRPSVAATEPVTTTPAVLSPVPSPTGCWQDMARQIPAIKVGDPVAYVEGKFMSNGVSKPLVQPDPNCRPTLATHWRGQHYIEFNGKEQHLCAEDAPVHFNILLPKPLYKDSPQAKVFEVKTSSSTSAQAIATVEQDMMRKWIR